MLKVENLSKRYGEQQIFCGLNLEINDGETLAVVGESGCGKTTLLRILSGLDKEYEGSVYINGKEARGLVPNQRNMALVFQQPVLWNHMTVEENILFPIRKRDRKANLKQIQHICQRLEIDDLKKRYPGEISGGQAKRVSLARALVAGKEILLMDEPLSNLDSDTKEKVLFFLEEEYLGHLTTIYVSHDNLEVSRLTENVMQLDSGIYHKI